MSTKYDLPLIATRPPRLSELTAELRAVEDFGTYSNGGPVVRRFEAALVEQCFGGEGACLAVANATLALMLAIRQARIGRSGQYALIPSFTFAAAAHAAIWAGLTPLICDVNPQDWAASAEAEEALLSRYGEQIAVIIPYDTFNCGIDLARYEALSARTGAGVVIDAAASLGGLDAAGKGYGTGTPFAAIYSMHATKPFAVAEGGVIYSADAALIEQFRAMHNFGFGAPRTATELGMNAKLPEVLGVLALAKLADIEQVAVHRAALAAAYREHLPDFAFQRVHGQRQIAQFMPLLLPEGVDRTRVSAELASQGIGSGHYFSPHLGQQPFFRETCVIEPTPVADHIGATILSLPLTDPMTVQDVAIIAGALKAATRTRLHAVPASPELRQTLLVGGGPAGTAMLISASKQNRLAELAQGLVIADAGHGLGGGQLANYAITSDSTAETFLSAVKDNPHPEIAQLMGHPGGEEIARYMDALGVPLARTGPFLGAMGERVGQVVRDNGGQILTGHQVVSAHRTRTGLWQSRLRDTVTGAERDIVSHNLVLATGGYQSPSEVAAERVAGLPLGERLGERLVPSDEALRLGGIDRLRTRLADRPAPRIAIVGASTSALAAATLLLKSSLPLGAGAITLLHRGPLRPFYPSAEAAHADGFTDFGPDDICPVSGFVYRLAGFRLEARALILRILGIGGRVPDPRLHTHRITGDDDAEAAALLDRSDITIGALGYRPHALPLFDMDGGRIALAAHAHGRPRLVDQQCRVIDAEGHPVPGAYGIGLAAGFVPSGRLGGEKSFTGKANGLWLWQNDVGQLIVDQLLDARAQAAA
ncbi:MAG: aminotransferase DegT [Sphingomonadales bacterium]|nr:MAG: aminotransferase DegT [Sphingomonadales bacterium]